MADEPGTKDEAIDQAVATGQLIYEGLRQTGDLAAALDALSDRLAGYEDVTGEPVMNLVVGAVPGGLGMHLSDLRSARLFLGRIICGTTGDLRHSLAVATQGGVPALVHALAPLVGLDGFSADIVGGTAGILAYQQLESLCQSLTGDA